MRIDHRLGLGAIGFADGLLGRFPRAFGANLGAAESGYRK
jgi:hypothetical protein